MEIQMPAKMANGRIFFICYSNKKVLAAKVGKSRHSAKDLVNILLNQQKIVPLQA
jgi:hypothetical protein